MSETSKRTELTTGSSDASKRTDLSPASSGKPLAPVSRGGGVLDQALNRLPPEQQDALMQKALEKRIDIEVQAAEAERAYTNFEEESNQAVRQVRELGRTGMDVMASYEGRTASGSWNVQVSKTSYTLLIVIAAIVGIILLALVLR